jgi:hypothetical protein
MNKIYSFQEQVEKSKEFEEKLLTYWSNCDTIKTVKDVRDSQEYRDMDIDFLVARFDDDILKIRTVEVKVDFKMARTNNLFIEKDGWLKKTRAETIVYLDALRKLCYYITTDSIRSLSTKRSDSWETRQITTGDFGGYTVTGHLMPYDDMVAHCTPLVEDLSNIL